MELPVKNTKYLEASNQAIDHGVASRNMNQPDQANHAVNQQVIELNDSVNQSFSSEDSDGALAEVGEEDEAHPLNLCKLQNLMTLKKLKGQEGFNHIQNTTE